MRSFSFRKTILSGVALALPLVVVFYILFRVVGIFQKAITPLAKKAGIMHFGGEIALTVVTILCLLLLVFLLGLLMQLGFIANFRSHLEDWLLKLMPSLNHFKVMADERLKIEDAANLWKPVLLQKADEILPAYVIEENEEWITLVLAQFPSTEPGGLLIIRRSAISYKEITMQQMRQCNRQFGKGYLKLIG